MRIPREDFPPGFAEVTQPLLDARLRTLEKLGQEEKLVCSYILEAFPELGRGPMCDEIVRGTGLPETTVSACLERLDGIDFMKVDAGTGQILVLYPLSSIPCPHRVHMKGKKPVYAM
jgi:hypothetical protein